jgi:hypothetical protein
MSSQFNLFPKGNKSGDCSDIIKLKKRQAIRDTINTKNNGGFQQIENKSLGFDTIMLGLFQRGLDLYNMPLSDAVRIVKTINNLLNGVTSLPFNSAVTTKFFKDFEKALSGSSLSSILPITNQVLIDHYGLVIAGPLPDKIYALTSTTVSGKEVIDVDVFKSLPDGSGVLFPENYPVTIGNTTYQTIRDLGTGSYTLKRDVAGTITNLLAGSIINLGISPPKLVTFLGAGSLGLATITNPNIRVRGAVSTASGNGTFMSYPFFDNPGSNSLGNVQSIAIDNKNGYYTIDINAVESRPSGGGNVYYNYQYAIRNLNFPDKGSNPGTFHRFPSIIQAPFQSRMSPQCAIHNNVLYYSSFDRIEDVFDTINYSIQNSYIMTYTGTTLLLKDIRRSVSDINIRITAPSDYFTNSSYNDREILRFIGSYEVGVDANINIYVNDVRVMKNYENMKYEFSFSYVKLQHPNHHELVYFPICLRSYNIATKQNNIVRRFKYSNYSISLLGQGSRMIILNDGTIYMPVMGGDIVMGGLIRTNILGADPVILFGLRNFYPGPSGATLTGPFSNIFLASLWSFTLDKSDNNILYFTYDSRERRYIHYTTAETYSIFKIDLAAQTISRYAGKVSSTFTNNPITYNTSYDASTFEFGGISAMDSDLDGNLYVFDYGRKYILKITKSASPTVTIVAGNGTTGTRDGMVETSSFSDVKDIAYNQNNNSLVVVSDGIAIRNIDLSISTIVPLTSLRIMTSTPYYTTITWDLQNNVSGYNIYRSRSLNSSQKLENEEYISSIQNNTFTIESSSLQGQGNYYYAVTAYYNKVSNETYFSNSLLIQFSPNPPINLVASNITTTGVTLNWTAPSGNVTGYNIFKDGVRVINVTSGTTFNVTGLINCTTYSFYVKAYYNINTNESQPSNTINIDTAPNAPRNLVGSTIPGSSAAYSDHSGTTQLFWTPPLGGVTGYNIYQDGVKIDIVRVGIAYQVTGLDMGGGRTYSFYVKAYYNTITNESVSSNTVNVITPPNRPTKLYSSWIITGSVLTGVTLVWEAPSGNVTGYNVYGFDGAWRLINVTSGTTFNVELIGGTRYSFYVTAYYNTNTNESTSSPGLSFTTYPNPPENLVKSNITADGVTLSWTPPSVGSVSGYNIYQDGVKIDSITGTTTYNVIELIGGRPYSFYVKAYYDTYTKYESVSSNTINVLISPNPPINLVASNITTTGVTLNWTAPSGNVTGYNIYKDGVKVINVTTGTRFNVTGLIDGTTYSFYVKSYYNTNTNESVSSNIVSTNSTGSNPSNLSTISATSDEIRLTWGKPSQGSVTGYNIYKDGVNIGSIQNPIDLILTYTVISLTASTQYSFYVKAYYGLVTSESLPSNTINVYTAPNAPTNLLASNTTANTTILNWTAPSGIVTGYNIYQNGIWLDNVINGTTYVVNGLNATTQYSFYVKAYRDIKTNESVSSNIANINTTPNAPINLSFFGSNSYSIALVWEAPSGNVTGYNIYKDGIKIGSVLGDLYNFFGIAINSINDKIYEVTGLTSSTQYSFYVKAYYTSDVNESLPSNTINVYTGPNAPTNLFINDIGATTATLNWTTPSGDVTGYNIYKNGNKITTGNNTRHIFNDLITCTSYNFYVKAYYNINTNESESSNIVNIYTAPNSPTNLVAKNITPTEITLEWDRPVGGNISGYTIYKDNVGMNVGNVNTFKFDNLLTTTLYSFYVRSYYYTPQNESINSNILDVYTSPNPPQNLVISEVTPTEIALSWTAPTEGSVSGYFIYKDGKELDVGNVTTYRFSQLTFATSYNFYIKSYYNIKQNQSIPTYVVNATTSINVVTGLKGIRSGDGVYLTWDISDPDRFPVDSYYLYRQQLTITDDYPVIQDASIYAIIPYVDPFDPTQYTNYYQNTTNYTDTFFQREYKYYIVSKKGTSTSPPSQTFTIVM